MKHLKIYLPLIAICFLAGAYYWKLTHVSVKLKDIPEVAGDDDSRDDTPVILVYVQDKAITSEDLDYEYSLHTSGVFDSEDLVAVPDLGERYEKQLTPLKERLLSGLIERKLLFTYIAKDKTFTIDDPGRFTRCLEDWQGILKENATIAVEAADQQRLKERLCEKSIVDQYLRERVFTKIDITDAEIKAYYQEHKKEFVKPKRVLIRQIVLATEEDAKKAKNGLTRSNFAERAKSLSIAPEAEKGGLVGPFAQGEMPRFFDLAFSLADGEIYGALKSNYGFHIIMLEKRYPKSEQSLEQSRKDIEKVLRAEKQNKEYKQWVESAINVVSIQTPGSRM